MGIEVQRVGHVVLKVTDLKRALGFYSGVLGLARVAQANFGDGDMIFPLCGIDASRHRPGSGRSRRALTRRRRHRPLTTWP